MLNGLSTSLFFTPCFAAVGHFFRERRGLATGIASTGGGVGGAVFPLMLQPLLQRASWPWAMRALGLACLVLAAAACLLVRSRLPPAAGATARPDLRVLLRDPAVAAATAGVFCMEFALFVPIAYISGYALREGLGPGLAAGALTVVNASSVAGRVPAGLAADRAGPFNVNIAATALAAAASLGVWLPAGQTLPGLVAFAVLFGFGTGNSIGITPVCVGRLCHTSEYGRYYATCYTVVSFACLISIPIAGNLITAAGGSFRGLIILTGSE